VGAFGRVRSFDTAPRTSWARRLGTLLAVMGPGAVVMAANNDAGTISVYAQAGQNYGFALLWPVFLLAPVLFVNQEMVARLGAVTGAGHARLIFERFGRRWGSFALADLLALNLVTIITELIGVELGFAYFGISRYLAVPVAALALVVITGSGRFRVWERMMLLLAAVDLVVIPLVFLSGRTGAGATTPVLHAFAGRLHGGGVLFVVAVVGTTVSSFQLFFQQSNVVDKRITSRWLAYERLDTLLGTLLFTFMSGAILVTCAAAFAGTPFHGAFRDAGTVAVALNDRLGSPAGALFALLLLNGSILGAGVVTLSTSYAIGDVFGVKHSLHRGLRDARTFYASFALSIAVAAAVVLVPDAPLGFVTTIVQALAGVLLPSATVFLLLLCNDRVVLGPWANPRWLNALATAVVAALLALSALLMLTTLHVAIEATTIVAVGGLLVAALVIVGCVSLRRPMRRPPFQGTPNERASWTMPRLETLPRPGRSRMRTGGLVILRFYVSFAAVLLVLRAVQAAFGG